MTEDIYLEVINVVRRLSEREVAVYRCLKKVPAGGYLVQNVDRVRVPVDKQMLRDQEVIFWELLVEQWPDADERFSATIEGAIESFHAAFP